MGVVAGGGEWENNFYNSLAPKKDGRVKKFSRPMRIYTVSKKSFPAFLSVCYKITLTTGGVGVAGACPPTSNLGTLGPWL